MASFLTGILRKAQPRRALPGDADFSAHQKRCLGGSSRSTACSSAAMERPGELADDVAGFCSFAALLPSSRARVQLLPFRLEKYEG
jgi:hypothetical protein